MKYLNIFKITITCFGSQGIHHQGAFYSAWLNYINGSIVSVSIDVVGVKAVYLPVVRLCIAQCREAMSV